MVVPSEDELQAEMVQQLSNEFDDVCLERHTEGAKKYGNNTFLGRDTLEMALEELADLANYVRYTYIQVRLLQEDLVAREAQRQQADVPMRGKAAFISPYRKDRDT